MHINIMYNFAVKISEIQNVSTLLGLLELKYFNCIIVHNNIVRLTGVVLYNQQLMHRQE